ncbi:MAG: SemiSWEET family sugar transporter [Paludibacteraceae bacterium]|nr:PQ-loop domain-containing transporter [Bacteroidales bacterium]
MDPFTITSSIAGICMAVCQVPQAIRILRTRDTSSISLTMQVILTAGILFWFVSGIILSVRDFWEGVPMWLSNGFCLISCLYILIMCIYNKIK